MTEELIHDRLSFRKFLDIRSDDDIPDETTICKFRNALMDKMLFDRIFEEVNKGDERAGAYPQGRKPYRCNADSQ